MKYGYSPIAVLGAVVMADPVRQLIHDRRRRARGRPAHGAIVGTAEPGLWSHWVLCSTASTTVRCSRRQQDQGGHRGGGDPPGLPELVTRGSSGARGRLRGP